jgi:hypothetical protein
MFGKTASVYFGQKAGDLIIPFSLENRADVEQALNQVSSAPTNSRGF